MTGAPTSKQASGRQLPPAVQRRILRCSTWQLREAEPGDRPEGSSDLVTMASERASAKQLDWTEVLEETARHLQRMIQIDTRNPPGNEMELALYLEGVLEAEGITTQLFEPYRDRAAIVARIAGTGRLPPVMLLAHMDVVAVEPEHWTVDPFGGVIRDGYVYGRGAIDDKGMLACNLMTMLLLRRGHAGAPLSRDVLFVATSDEEAGGEYGLQWLIDNHPELLKAEFALNEGGRIRIVGGRARYAAIQTSEKVSHVLTVTARGPSGHAAIPLPDNALTRLGRALTIVASQREPARLLPTTRRFFAQLADVWPDHDVARAMAGIVSDRPETAAEAERALAGVPVLDAVLRSGISPTILSGGRQSNVIPPEAQAVLCVRTLPGDSVEQIAARLSAAIGDPQVEVAVEQRGMDAPESSFDSPLFRALEQTISDLVPGLIAVPYLSTGATDSARLRRWGMDAFGLLPFPLEEVDEKRMHGHDERVSLDALRFGVRLVFESIVRVAG
jgi:acetylornithine deacetylase/succinyl-diaminopimelate desuccinylase-like protein